MNLQKFGEPAVIHGGYSGEPTVIHAGYSGEPAMIHLSA